MASRGKVIAPYVMAWIAGRGGGHSGSHPVAGKCLSEITSIVRDWIDEDVAAGRPPIIEYVEKLFGTGFLYMDRRKSSNVRQSISASQAKRLAPLKPEVSAAP